MTAFGFGQNCVPYNDEDGGYPCLLEANGSYPACSRYRPSLVFIETLGKRIESDDRSGCTACGHAPQCHGRLGR